jgi:hypothetical protein
MTSTEVALYRSVRKEDFPDGVIVDDHAVQGVLYPSFEEKTIEVRGLPTTRLPDVRPYKHDGEDVIDPGGGTSLFDKANVFGKKFWWSFEIPKGTVVPDSLKIVPTGRNVKYQAEHYQIEAATGRMPVATYKGALDNLARNAVVRLCERAHAGD